MSDARRFPPPWTVEELAACFVVTDNAGQKLSYTADAAESDVDALAINEQDNASLIVTCVTGATEAPIIGQGSNDMRDGVAGTSSRMASNSRQIFNNLLMSICGVMPLAVAASYNARETLSVMRTRTLATQRRSTRPRATIFF